MTFKIAVIGCGWVSMDCHGPAYARYAAARPGVELSACCDLDAQRAEKFGDRFDFKHRYTDYARMLQAEKPDAVCLNVPPEATCAIGCAVLEQGYPLLCEKPPGMSIEEIDALLAVARQSGAIHQVAFNRRFMPLVRALKNQLNGQAVQAMEIVLARYRRLEADFTTTAVHVIDLARFLPSSDFREARFRYSQHEATGQLVTNYLLDGVLESGATARISIYPATGMTVERATVYCADQTFCLACSNGLDAPGWLRVYQGNRLISETDGAQLAGSVDSYLLNGFFAEDTAFFDAVQAGKQPSDDLLSARQSVAIMQAMRERRDQYI
jgi:myo-inositol 2-dehydrogenase/D-chiro-inositol 1-dehydrogenase